MLASESHGATLDAPPGFWEVPPASIGNRNHRLKPRKSRAGASRRTGILTVLSRFPSRCRCRDVPQVGWIRIFGVGSEFPRARAGDQNVAASRAAGFCGCSPNVAWQPGLERRAGTANRVPIQRDRAPPTPKDRGSQSLDQEASLIGEI